MAVTADGFIAKTNGDSDWVSDVDTPIFEKKIKDIGCIVVGGNTYRQFKGQVYPAKNALNIVVSNVLESKEDGVFFVKSPREAIELVRLKNFDRVLLVGGGHVNGSFLKEGLVDEVFVDVHPLVLGKGIKIFEGFEGVVKLDLLEFKNLDKGQILLRYKVIK
jgi:dihydrofolate reductase